MRHAKKEAYGGSKTPAVAYTMAYLNYITLGNIDLLKIWDHQQIPERVAIAFNNLCDKMRVEIEASARIAGMSVNNTSKKKTVYQEMTIKDFGFNANDIREIMNDN